MILDSFFDEGVLLVQLAQIASAAEHERAPRARRQRRRENCQTTEPSNTYWLSVSSTVVSAASSASPLTRTWYTGRVNRRPALHDDGWRHDEPNPRLHAKRLPDFVVGREQIETPGIPCSA